MMPKYVAAGGRGGTDDLLEKGLSDTHLCW